MSRLTARILGLGLNLLSCAAISLEVPNMDHAACAENDMCCSYWVRLGLKQYLCLVLDRHALYY